MKIDMTIPNVLFDTLEGGDVFLFEESVCITIRESLYDKDGYDGQEYNAVDLETGEPRFFFGSELVRPLNVTLKI